MIRYAITDRGPSREPSREPSCEPGRGLDRGKVSTAALLEQQATRLANQGVDFLQVREKDLQAKELIDLTRRIITSVRKVPQPGEKRLRVLVNGRPDIANAAAADGVHLPSGTEQLTVAHVRQVFAGRSAIVSVACHTLPEVEEASRGGADLILFSPVFEKSIGESIVSPGTGIDMLRRACAVAGRTPVLALGGVTADRVAACLAAGAKGVAAIRLFQ